MPMHVLLSLVLSQAVVMDVSVVAEKVNKDTGLTAADFTILEDNKPARVNAVNPVSVSLDANEGRIAVLFMDDSTPSPTGEEKQAKEIAHHFIDALGPSDVAGVLFATNQSGVQSLTTDRTSLKAAVNRFQQRIGQWSVSNSDTGGR